MKVKGRMSEGQEVLWCCEGEDPRMSEGGAVGRYVG